MWLKNGSLWDKWLFSEVFGIIWELGVDRLRNLLVDGKNKDMFKNKSICKVYVGTAGSRGPTVKTMKWEIPWLSHRLLLHWFLISFSSINKLQTLVKSFHCHPMQWIFLCGAPLGMPKSEMTYRCTFSGVTIPSYFQKRRERNKHISSRQHPKS